MGVVVLPGCGPAAVTNAPDTISARYTTTAAHARTPRRPPTTERAAAGRKMATVAQVESETTAMASRKCDMTRYGFRSNATVTAPSGTCATVPAAASASA